MKIQRKISSIYGIDFIFLLISLLFIAQKAVKVQIIVKIMEKMMPIEKQNNFIDFLIIFYFIDFRFDFYIVLSVLVTN